MSTFKTLPLIALMALAGPALAQETPTEDSTTDAPATDAPATEPTQGEAPAEIGTTDGLSLGEEVTGEPQPGDTYTLSEHSDWQVRCVKLDGDRQDPCQLYQLLQDQQGNSVAEVNLFGLEGGGQIVAGANIVTPLETLLTEQLTMSIDDATPRRYPFTFCAPIGCVSRIGLTAADVGTFKLGNQAVISIVPLGAPDQRVNLAMSLSGFTAGYEAVLEANKGSDVQPEQ